MRISVILLGLLVGQFAIAEEFVIKNAACTLVEIDNPSLITKRHYEVIHNPAAGEQPEENIEYIEYKAVLPGGKFQAFGALTHRGSTYDVDMTLWVEEKQVEEVPGDAVSGVAGTQFDYMVETPQALRLSASHPIVHNLEFDCVMRK